MTAVVEVRLAAIGDDQRSKSFPRCSRSEIWILEGWTLFSMVECLKLTATWKKCGLKCFYWNPRRCPVLTRKFFIGWLWIRVFLGKASSIGHALDANVVAHV
ncbi:hypothetical protein ACLOJK_021748 [Asimina triloba]